MREVSLDKFRGTLVAALMGDCLGSQHEFVGSVDRDVIQNYYDINEEPDNKHTLYYTDDSVMTKGIAASFVEKKTLDCEDIARRFVDNYYADPARRYGGHVRRVFKILKQTDFEDVFLPAALQFEGKGSWGNGGAMRVSPVALFYCSDYDTMLIAAEKISRITHTHKLGINGALLQAIAVHKCLHLDPNQPINVSEFLQDIMDKMKKIEILDEKTYGIPEFLSILYYRYFRDSYYSKLIQLQSLLEEENPSDSDVIKKLGNGSDVSALLSVPTAIYCFLRGQKPIPGLETDNLLRRVTSYCITLGGDTDTIASMAGALCGAYLGYSSISKELQNNCESLEERIKLADDLYSVTFPT